MRLARALCAHDQHDPKINAIVTAANLNLLQLDYDFQIVDEGSVSRSATGFLKQMESLAKTFFLESELQLITNAGGYAVVECAELLGHFLSDRGAPELPITAVRGANVLPRLEELYAEGVPLVDEHTGRSILDFSEPLLSAHVQLGAGPIAAALAEGSRIIICQCYDSAAPFLAAAVHAYGWLWNQYDALANAATAANLAQLTNSLNSLDDKSGLLSMLPPVFELAADGSATILPLLHQEFNKTGLLESLHASVSGATTLSNADIRTDITDIDLQTEAYGSLSIRGVLGEAPQQDWILTAIFADGFCATALFAITDVNALQRAEGVKASLDSLFQAAGFAGQDIRTECLQPLEDCSVIYLRISCKSFLKEPVLLFIQEIANYAVRNESQEFYLLDAPLQVRRTTRSCQVYMDPDVVDVSIDTRTAREWY